MQSWGTSFRSRVVQRFAAGAAKNVLCVFAGTNDGYVDATSPADVFAMLDGVVTESIAAGFKVVVCPMLSRTSSSAAWTATTMDEWKNTHNGLILASASRWGANARIVPASSLAGLIEDGTYSGGNFQDGTHPTQTATTDIIAPAFATEVDAFG